MSPLITVMAITKQKLSINLFILVIFLYYKREDKKGEGRVSADIWRKAYFKVLQENRLRYRTNFMIIKKSNTFQCHQGGGRIVRKGREEWVSSLS